MAVHLIKLCVGADSISDLEKWQKARVCAGQELIHVTRHMPKRADEVLDGGSLYWVINGHIAARQNILELRKVLRDGVPHCGIVYDPKLVRVVPRPHRPFQGWRYFDAKSAPKDMKKSDAGSEKIQRELAEMGLL